MQAGDLYVLLRSLICMGSFQSQATPMLLPGVRSVHGFLSIPSNPYAASRSKECAWVPFNPKQPLSIPQPYTGCAPINSPIIPSLGVSSCRLGTSMSCCAALYVWVPFNPKQPLSIPQPYTGCAPINSPIIPSLGVSSCRLGTSMSCCAALYVWVPFNPKQPLCCFQE